jgi:hypothetical protein
MLGTDTFSSWIIAAGYMYFWGFIGYRVGKKRIIGATNGAVTSAILGWFGLFLVFSSKQLHHPKTIDQPEERVAP